MFKKVIAKSVGGYLTCFTGYQVGRLFGDDLINRAQKKGMTINQESVDSDVWNKSKTEKEEKGFDYLSLVPFYQQKGDFTSWHLTNLKNVSLDQKDDLKNFNFKVDPETLQVAESSGPVLSKRDGSMVILAGLTSLLTPGLFVGIQVVNFGVYGVLGAYRGIYSPLQEHTMVKNAQPVEPIEKED